MASPSGNNKTISISKCFIFLPFYTLIFISADTSELLLWRSRAFILTKFSPIIFNSLVKVKHVPIYVGERWGHLAEKLSLPPPLSELTSRKQRIDSASRCCPPFLLFPTALLLFRSMVLETSQLTAVISSWRATRGWEGANPTRAIRFECTSKHRSFFRSRSLSYTYILQIDTDYLP